MKIAACQTPDIRKDIPQAISVIDAFATRAEAHGAELVVFPECFLQGYLLEASEARKLAVNLDSKLFLQLIQHFRRVKAILVVGLIEASKGRIYNTACIIQRGHVIGRYRKVHLRGIESEVFDSGDCVPIFGLRGQNFAVNICNDLNHPACPQAAKAAGAKVLLCPANNMLPRDMAEAWKFKHNEIRANRAREAELWLISADVCGSRNGHICYGPTAAIDPRGEVVEQLPLMKPGLLITDCNDPRQPLLSET